MLIAALAYKHALNPAAAAAAAYVCCSRYIDFCAKYEESGKQLPVLVQVRGLLLAVVCGAGGGGWGVGEGGFIVYKLG
jgi:hypothetical protein